jgi:hypothetical protein
VIASDTQTAAQIHGGSRHIIKRSQKGALMTVKQTQHHARPTNPQKARTNPRRAGRKTDWDDAQITVDIKYTKPGTLLDDRLRIEQTRVLLELLSAYRADDPSTGREDT